MHFKKKKDKPLNEKPAELSKERNCKKIGVSLMKSNAKPLL